MQQRGEGDRSDKATRVRIAVMALLCGLSFLTYYDRQCIVRAQEGIQESLAISDEQMGLVFGAFWLAYALFEIPGGWMGERFGTRVTLTRIVLAWSIFTALTGAATGFVSLLLFRFLFGVGEAALIRTWPKFNRAGCRVPKEHAPAAHFGSRRDGEPPSHR